MDKACPEIKKCRVCGNANLERRVDLGEQYLSSIFPENLDYRSTLPKYPLGLALCIKNKKTDCGLLQLNHDLDLTEMYGAYPYTSSSNSSMKGILEDVAKSGIEVDCLKKGDLILDIGCNDGTLLSFFQNKGYNLLGIDAAKNIKPNLKSTDFSFVSSFFNRETFEKNAREKAKLIFSIAMFYHLSDPLRFANDVAACLHSDGVWIIQMAYLPAMLETNMYDNIVHEHNGYYGIETIEWVLDKAGLEVFDVLTNDVYGGSYRVFAKKKGNQKFEKTPRYHKLLAAEKTSRLFELETYRNFERRIQKTREDLKALLKKLKSEGKTVWVYGASTKGNTILQYCGLSSRDIVAAADANSFKFGKFIIGSDLLIKNEEEMRREKPDYLLALPYSFVSGFMSRESDLINQGTKFIVPLPEIRILP